MELPETVFVRQKEILQWSGMTKDDLRKLVEAGIIRRILFAGRKRAVYLRDQIVQAVSNPEQGKAVKKKCYGTKRGNRPRLR